MTGTCTLRRTNLNLSDDRSGPIGFLTELWGRFSYQYYSACAIFSCC